MNLLRSTVVPLLIFIRLSLYLVRLARRFIIRVVRVAVEASLIFFVAILILAWIVPRVTAAEIHPLTPARSAAAGMAQPAPTCVELVVNGGFEQTALGWDTVAGASLFAYATDQYASGRHSLLLGSTAPLNITATFGVEQLLTLPQESISIEFAFNYAVQTDGGVDAGDQAYLTIHDAVTNQLLAMLVLSPTNAAWSMGRYDLTPLAGKNIRLTFMTQNDGDLGRLAMRVDDVSILACLPPESFALEALPTPQPTIVPPTPELLLLTPVPPPTSPPSPAVGTEAPSAVTPAVTPAIAAQITPSVPQAGEVFPQASVVDSLEACRCDSSLYACTSFSNWAVAQACYTHCQVTAGYDIHNLDEDRNGIACELELQDIAPLDAIPSPQPTPSSADDASTLPLTEPVGAANMTGADASLAVSDAVSNTVDSAVSSTVSSTVTMPVASGISDTRAVTVAIAAAPADQQPSRADTTIAQPPTASAASSSSLSPFEMLSLLLFSPLGYLALAILGVVGVLSLWIAYMLGQRGRRAKTPLAGQPEANKPATEDDFALQSNTNVPLPKA